MRVVAFLLALLMASSVAMAQSSTIDNPEVSTPTTLYFHLDAHQDFPINTQPPDDRYAKGSTRGLLASTTTCTPEGTPGQFHQDHHTVYGFSTPGYVEYEYEEDGGPRIHPERGLAYNVLLDDEGMTGYWYLKTTVDSNQASSDINNLPVLVPQVVVRFTMRTGDEVSFGAEAYNEGEVIAIGESAPVVLLPSEETPGYHAQDDGSHVYEIQVPLDVKKDEIPADEDTGGYNLRVDVFTQVPGCQEDPDASFMPGSIEIYTSPEHRPRLDLAVMNPVRIDYIHPQFVGTDLLIHTSLNSPWGNYDVDETEGGITMEVSGPTTASSVFRVAFEQKHHQHGYHFEAVDVTYQWDYAKDQAADASYDLTVTVWNDQRTASATGSATIDVGSLTATDDEGNVVKQVETDEKETPIPALLPLLGMVGAALVARRRA